MNQKELRRQKAMKKARITKIIMIAVCAIIAGVTIGLLALEALQVSDDRVFVNAENHITLRGDGTFVAFLPHNTRFSGTYAETSPLNGIKTLTFNYHGRISSGRIDGEFLIAPDAWDTACAHGHGLVYRLR
ncbi:MAG: hypothetical protein FWF81_11230 [Defluviitaleaceae bacterium]|nr:hypothetical protein [Defluviitaleaceae bacterium]